MTKLIEGNIKKLMLRKEETPFVLKLVENRKKLRRTQKEAKEKLTNDFNKEPNLKEVRSSKRQKRNPAMRNADFLWIME